MPPVGGGVRAQQAFAEAQHAHVPAGQPAQAAPANSEHSAMVTKCLSMWSLGDLPATTCQQMAMLAILDGAQHVELAELASCGSFGAHPGNCTRDLITKFCGDVAICEPHLTPTFFRDPKTSLTVQDNMAIFLPCHMIHSLATYDEFAAFMGVSQIRLFWDMVEASNCPKLIGHEMKNIPNWKDYVIPLWVHGDGVEYQDRDSMMVWSTGSLLSLLSSLDSSLLIAANAKSCTVPESATCPGTWRPVWVDLHWSYRNLALGYFQDTYADGTPCPLAGQNVHPLGYKFYIWTLQGDHEHFSNTLGLPHWRSNKICWACDCDVQPIDDQENPKTWKKLIAPTWVLKTPQEHVDTPASHYVFTCPGVSTLMVANDGLHVIFNHGILGHFIGSILHVWCYHGRGRQMVAPTIRLGLIFDKVQEFYRDSDTDCRTRLTNLKLSMFLSNVDGAHADYPNLNTKGGETKHLLPAICYCMSLLNEGTELHMRIIAALTAINKFVLVMDAADWVPTRREADRLRKYALRFLHNYEWLHNWATAEDKLLFNLVPKFHMFDHLSYAARHLNPAASWCFKNEDYVGKISKICLSVAFGTKSTKLSQKLMRKYRFTLHLRLIRPLAVAE